MIHFHFDYFFSFFFFFFAVICCDAVEQSVEAIPVGFNSPRGGLRCLSRPECLFVFSCFCFVFILGPSFYVFFCVFLLESGQTLVMEARQLLGFCSFSACVLGASATERKENGAPIRELPM